jgi:hypothetical protein
MDRNKIISRPLQLLYVSKILGDGSKGKITSRIIVWQ